MNVFRNPFRVLRIIDKTHDMGYGFEYQDGGPMRLSILRITNKTYDMGHGFDY